MTPDKIILEMVGLYEQGLTSETKPRVAELVQQLRHEMKLTLREFTNPLNTSPQTAHRWEHGLSVPSTRQLSLLKNIYSGDRVQPVLKPVRIVLEKRYPSIDESAILETAEMIKTLKEQVPGWQVSCSL